MIVDPSCKAGRHGGLGHSAKVAKIQWEKNSDLILNPNIPYLFVK